MSKFLIKIIKLSFIAVLLFSMISISVRAQEGILEGPHILLDYDSGKVLMEKDAFQRWHPASLTKMMTAYVVFRKIREGKLTLKSPVYYSRNASRRPPSKMGFKVGSVFNIENALKMIIVKSANDVAVAIAESVSGSVEAFAREMNKTARDIGMRDTNFVNPHGLHDNNQYSSVRDMALLVMAIGKEFPQYAPLFKIEAIQYGKRVYQSYNKLLQRFQGADGMKTGYVCASGFNLAASATRSGKRLIAIVFGERSGARRAIAAAKLLHEGFAGQHRGKTNIKKLKPRGTEISRPINMRNKICPPRKKRKKKSAKKTKKKPIDPQLTLKGSRYLHNRVQHQKPVVIRLGDTIGTNAAGIRLPNGKFLALADIPIPTKRPN